jgi:hypothetical protein
MAPREVDAMSDLAPHLLKAAEQIDRARARLMKIGKLSPMHDIRLDQAKTECLRVREELMRAVNTSAHDYSTKGAGK